MGSGPISLISALDGLPFGSALVAITWITCQATLAHDSKARHVTHAEKPPAKDSCKVVHQIRTFNKCFLGVGNVGLRERG